MMQNLLQNRFLLIAIILLLAASTAVGVMYGSRRTAEPISLQAAEAIYGQDTSRLTVAGVAVNYRDEGSGPVLLLLHGSFGSLRMFDELASKLVNNFRVIRYDQPPSGLSGPVPADFTMTMEDFLAAFLDELKIERAALLGTSSGGIIGYRFAAAYPERVDALILSNVPPSAPVDNAAAFSRLSPFLQWSISTCFKQGQPWSKTCWRDFLKSNFWRLNRVTDALATEYYDLNRRVGAFGLSSMTAIMRDDDEVVRFLAAVRAPTLLLWGGKDPVLPPDTARLMERRLGTKQKRIVMFNDVSHYPPLEAPEEIAAASQEFLDAIYSAPR